MHKRTHKVFKSNDLFLQVISGDFVVFNNGIDLQFLDAITHRDQFSCKIIKSL